MQADRSAKLNAKLFAVGGAVLTVCAAAFVTVRAPAKTPIAEQPPRVALTATVAQERQPALTVKAVSGTLSDFWGEATPLTDDLWLMENADATSIVIASGDTLTVYFLDGRPQTVAKVVSGSTRDFMEIAVNTDCGECTNQHCCDTNCPENTCRWCLCSARVSCPGGISQYSCTTDPFSCSFSCFEVGG